MIIALQVVALTLVALALTPALAHALEFPGKLRLAEQDYLATQTIYYPGFTLVGPAEPLGVIALIAAVLFWNGSDAGWWLTVIAVVGLAAAHAIYWLVTHPVNRLWLKDSDLTKAGEGFFGFAQRNLGGRDWTALRDRWEYSHVVRAACIFTAFVCFATALAIG